MVNETNSTGPANPKAVFFDICDTLGIVERKRHLVKYQPTTDQLLDAVKQVVRIGKLNGLFHRLPRRCRPAWRTPRSAPRAPSTTAISPCAEGAA